MAQKTIAERGPGLANNEDYSRSVASCVDLDQAVLVVLNGVDIVTAGGVDDVSGAGDDQKYADDFGYEG
jgi:hypothetical protein